MAEEVDAECDERDGDENVGAGEEVDEADGSPVRLAGVYVVVCFPAPSLVKLI